LTSLSESEPLRTSLIGARTSSVALAQSLTPTQSPVSVPPVLPVSSVASGVSSPLLVGFATGVRVSPETVEPGPGWARM
jgi:hypothetical protein